MSSPKASGEKMHDRVLLVTEDLQAGDIWAHALKQQGVEVILEGSANGAVQRWAEGAFDAAIIDLYAQQLDGIALCRRLRTATGKPVLLLTPERDEARLLEAYQSGVDECIVKPVGPLVLVAKVLSWLRCRRPLPTEALPDEGP